MRKKVLWVIVSAVIIIAMLLTACKTTTTTTTTTAATQITTTTTTTATTTTTTPTSAISTAPKYGGSLNFAFASEQTSFDSYYAYAQPFCHMIYDQLLTGNIQTTEDQWPFYGIYIPKQYIVGCLADSWEEVAIDTVIFHLKHGVHFANLPPVNGREMVAADVVWSFNRLIAPQSQVLTAHNLNLYWQLPTPFVALDDYTIQYKYNPNQVSEDGWWGTIVKSSTWVIPHEVADANGGSLANPIGQVGSGPFKVSTYVPGSTMTFTKNHDYFLEDVRYPGNKLPYVDKVTFTIIPDLSTRVSALRTGKISRMSSIPVNQGSSLIGVKASNGLELQYRKMISEASIQISWRMDIPPMANNLKLHQALSMAIDRQSIVDNLFQGNASYSAARVPVSWPEFITLDKYPADIQQNFQYNPTLAKQFMTDAGFPNGTNLEVICTSTDTDGLNILQVVKANWADALNVNLTIKVMDPSQATTLQLRHTFPQGYYSPAGISYPSFSFTFLYQPDNTFRIYNVGNYKDATYNKLYENYINTWQLPWDQRYPSWFALNSYVREQCVATDLPVPNTYMFWQPWLKGQWGQGALNYNGTGELMKYEWIDTSY